MGEYPSYIPAEVDSSLQFERTQDFLNSIKRGEQIAFFDMDKCIWDKNTDIERWSIDLGLIPKERHEAWQEALKNNKGDDDVTFPFYTRAVTPQLAAITGLTPGTLFSAEAMQRVGNYIGNQIVDTHRFRDTAVEVLKLLPQKSIRPVILTSSPTALTLGVLETASPRLNLPHIDILGSKDSFHPDGQITEDLFFTGHAKTKVVSAAVQRGAFAVLGVGDRPSSADTFVWSCRYPAPINNDSPLSGEEDWQRVHAFVSQLPTQQY